MNLRQLEVFHAIMLTGSVTAAARKLNVSQPAISAVLRHCEQQLQMPLFTRKGARLTPTPEALTLYPDVAAIFDRVLAVDRLSEDLRGGLHGTLSIAACFPEANGIVAQAIASFMLQRPEVRVALYAVSSPNVQHKVANREVDLGIAYGPVVHAEIETETLFHSSIACVLRRDHPLSAQASIRVEQLATERIISYLNQSWMRSYVDRAFSDARVVPNLVAQVSVSLSGMMLARHGAGIAVVEPLLLSALELPDLVARPLDPNIVVTTLALRHKVAPKARLQDDFLEHLQACCHAAGYLGAT